MRLPGTSSATISSFLFNAKNSRDSAADNSRVLESISSLTTSYSALMPSNKEWAMYNVNFNIRPILNYPKPINSNIFRLIEDLANNKKEVETNKQLPKDQQKRDLLDSTQIFLRLCSLIAEGDFSRADKEKELLASSLKDRELVDYVRNLSQTDIQELFFIPFMTNRHQGPLISPDTLNFFLRYNNSDLKNLFTKLDMENFANQLVGDFNNNHNYLSKQLSVLRSMIQDDRKFIQFLLPNDPKKSFISPTKKLISSTQDPIKYLAETILGLLETDSTGDRFPNEGVDGWGTPIREKQLERLETFLNRIIHPESPYNPNDEISSLIASLELTTPPSVETFKEFIFLSLMHLKLSLDQINKENVLIPENSKDHITQWNEILKTHRGTEKIKDVLEIIFKLSLLKQVLSLFCPTDEAVHKILATQIDLRELFKNGFSKSLEIIREYNKTNIGDLPEIADLNKIKSEFREQLVYRQESSLIFKDEEAFKIILQHIMDNYSGDLNSLKDNKYMNLIPNYRRNKKIKEGADLPYIVYKAFTKIFDFNPKELELFQQKLDSLRNKVYGISPYKYYRNLIAAVILSMGITGGATWVVAEHLKNSQPPAVYSAVDNEPHPQETRSRKLIREVLKLLPEEFKFTIDNKEYTIPKKSFYCFEIPGHANKVTAQDLDPLIDNIIENYREFEGKRNDLREFIQNRLKQLSKYPDGRSYDPGTNVPLVIPTIKGPVIVIIVSSADIKRAITEPNTEAGLASFQRIAYTKRRFPDSLKRAFYINRDENANPEPYNVTDKDIKEIYELAQKIQQQPSP
jgi:hypothetical protein